MPIYTIKTPSGHELDINAETEADAIAGAEHWHTQNVTNKTDTSGFGALQQGAVNEVSGLGKTIKEYISPGAGKAVQDAAAAKADPKYKSAYEGFANPEDGADKHFMGLGWSNAPRALLEQAPGLALDVGTQMLLKKLGIGGIGRTIAGMGVFGARTAGNEAQKRATARTGDDSAEPNFEDKAVGLGSTVAQGALNTFSAGKLAAPGNAAKGIIPAAGNVTKAALTEGATNGAQDLISQGAATAGTDAKIDTKDTLAQTVLGTLGGGAFAAPHMAKAGAQKFTTRGTDQGEHTTFATNRLIEKAGGVSNLEDGGNAFSAMKGATKDVKTEFATASKAVVDPATETANAIARAKEGSILTKSELDAIDAAGNDHLSSLAREQNSLATMRKRGYFNEDAQTWTGGASGFARNHVKSALSALTGIPAAAHFATRGMAGLDSFSAAIPGIAEAVGGGLLGYQAVKKIEKMLGTQSPGLSFAERFGDASGQVRPDTPVPTKPAAPTPFKPDVLEPGIRKIVEKIQNQKRRDTAQEAMPLLRQLAEQNQPAPEAPGMDVAAINEQIKGAMLMASARRKIAGQQQAEAEAAASPMVNEQGGLDAVRNPAMGKRLNELLSATTALERARRQPEQEEAPTPAPEPPVAPAPAAPINPGVAEPKVVDTRGATPQSPQAGASIVQQALAAMQAQRANTAAEPEAFALPESQHVFKDPETAARDIYAEAVAGGKEIRHAEGFKAGTKRRLAGEETIYNNISNALSSVQERGAFHKYLSALWGSDSPEVVKQVRDHMLAEFPQHAATINKHLSDEAIKGLWTKPKKKK